MNGCVYKTADGQCEKFSDKNRNTMSWCLDGPCGYETPSNADRIRGMTDEELAKWIVEIADCDECEEMHGFRMCDAAPEKACEDCWAGWLKAPVEVQDGT